MNFSGTIRNYAVLLASLIVAAACTTVLLMNYVPVDGTAMTYGSIFLKVLAVVCAAALLIVAMFSLIPADARKVDWNDLVVAILVSAAIVLLISEKWIAPLLNQHLPIGPWSKLFVVTAAALLAVAAPRKFNVQLARLASRYPAWFEKETLAVCVGLWTYFMCSWINTVRMEATRSTIRIGGITIVEVASMNSVVLLPIVLVALALVFWFLSRDHTPKEQNIGRVFEGARNGYPVLGWSQLAATSETAAGFDTRRRFKIYFGVVAAAALAGFASGSAENALFYAMAAAWLGALGLRGAGTFAMQGQTLAHVPHVKTDEERREELTPMARREDCEAFVEENDGTLWFCIARGTAREGAMPVVERVPFDSFGNFEEGSHKQWFRPRGSVNQTLDWGVIVAQSSVGRIVLVAESLHEQAWLIELLVKLQTTFIAPRDAMLQALKEAEHKRRADDEPTGSSGAPIDATPVKPF